MKTFSCDPASVHALNCTDQRSRGCEPQLEFSIPELRDLIEEQRATTTILERETGSICPWVFHRAGRPIKFYRRSWNRACCEAGCPGYPA